MIYEHGGDIYSREVEHDFSANINPLGMPKSVKNALIGSIKNCESYPDPNCMKLTAAISEYENIPVENIVCGNGAADLIYRITRAFNPKKAMTLAPTFGEYEKALNECGCSAEYFNLCEENGFKLDEYVLYKLNESFDMLFICNPNNPVGNLIEKNLLEKIAAFCRQKNILLVCDECFLDFAKNADDFSAKQFMNDNVIILKAFTKIYAMPGLRLGYALFGSAKCAEEVRGSGQSWSVSVMAQAAGLAALGERCYVARTVNLIAYERDYLAGALKSCGFKVYGSDVNFILFKCDVPLDELLIKKKIAVRNCKNYIGLDEKYFRIAVRSHDENTILVSAIGEALDQWQSR